MDIAGQTEAAAWIPARLHPFAEDVGSIIPVGFAAYARVFHPPYRNTPDGNRFHTLAHQLSQRVTPARNRMTFRHFDDTKRERCRVPRELIGVGPLATSPGRETNEVAGKREA